MSKLCWKYSLLLLLQKKQKQRAGGKTDALLRVHVGVDRASVQHSAEISELFTKKAKAVFLTHQSQQTYEHQFHL